LIKIQTVKNTINIYFKSSSAAVTKAGLLWTELESHFLPGLPGYRTEWFRGSNNIHIKKNHTHSAEVDIEHFHREFDSEITPDLFSSYLMGVFEQQCNYEEELFQFFIDRDEVETILEKYQNYYSLSKENNLEKDYCRDTGLTIEERLQLRCEILAQSPMGALLSSINTGSHPVYRSNPRAIAPVKEDNPVEEDQNGCNLM